MFVFSNHKARKVRANLRQVVLTIPGTGRQSVAGNFSSKTGSHLHVGRVRKWRLIIFPKDKTRSTDAWNRTLDPRSKVRCSTDSANAPPTVRVLVNKKKTTTLKSC